MQTERDSSPTASLKILLLYSKSTEEVFSRKSALGSYISCLYDILIGEKYSVDINGLSDLHSYLKQGSQTQNNHKKPLRLSRFLPKQVKLLINDFRLFIKHKRLIKRCEMNAYDLIIEFYSYGSNVGRIVSQRKNIPLLVVYDGPIIEEFEHFHGRKRFLTRLIKLRELNTIRQADRIIVYSPSVQRYLMNLVDISQRVAIHQNVDFSRLNTLHRNSIIAEPINICFVGSFLPWHNVAGLVKAFCKLRNGGMNVKLYLVGEGMLYRTIKGLCEASPCSNDIMLTGYLDGDELEHMKAKMHIGVMPGSNWYGAPNKLFEYGAAQMAVIAPATPTISDLFIDNVDLLLFNQDLAEDLYLKLKSLVVDHRLISRLSTNLKHKVLQNHSREKTAQFYAKIVSSCLKQKIR